MFSAKSRLVSVKGTLRSLSLSRGEPIISTRASSSAVSSLAGPSSFVRPAFRPVPGFKQTLTGFLTLLVTLAFIPIVGDITDATLNYTLVLRKAKQAELPRWLINKMYFNNTVSLGVSFIPIAGDIILGVWKANSRNAALLEEFLRIRGEEFLKGESSRVQGECIRSRYFRVDV